MRPSYKWFPMNLPEQVAWLRNFNQKLQGIGASFGLTPAELDMLDKDIANIHSSRSLRTAFPKGK